MKIAITAQLFNDSTRIGSLRPRAVAQRLAELGHEVTVFTAGVPQDRQASPPPGVAVVELPEVRSEATSLTGVAGLLRKAAILPEIFSTLPRSTFYKNPRLSKFSRLTDSEKASAERELALQRRYSVAMVDLIIDNLLWSRESIRQLKHSTQKNEFDVVFSTYGPFGSAWLGQWMKRQGRASAWVSDFRDPVYQPMYRAALSTFLHWQQIELVRKPTWVTTVSKGYKKALTSLPFTRRYRDKITVITNGFTRRTELADSGSTQPGPLRIGYLGMLYWEREDLLAQFLRTLVEVTATHPDLPIEFHYAGLSQAPLDYAAQRSDSQALVHNHGPLSHEDALRLQGDMDALLVLSWNDEGREGVLPGKFLEYLGADKPIIGMISGALPDAELAELIRELRVGIACEESGGEADIHALKEFLIEGARRRKEGHALTFEPNEAAVQAFEYTAIADRIEAVLAEVHQSS